ncbi:TonB-dependent receptor [Phocaeicola sp.]
MTRLLVLLILITLTLPGAAQKNSKNRKEKAYHLTGGVTEQNEKTRWAPVQDVNIRLYALPDTTFVGGTVTDKDGRYNLYAASPGNYLLKASFLGYETVEKKLNVAAYDTKKYIGYIEMKPASIVLNETVIKAELQKMKMSGDTLVYNTEAFKTSEGAVLQDLVRQLPGLELDQKTGKMSLNGKEISRILLNGKEFFADKNVALNNLPVEALKEVKVYEQQSDKERMTGVDDGKKQTVMDVKTKNNLTDGVMGDVSASKGSEDTYEAKLGVNKFTGKWRMSLNGDLGKMPLSMGYISNYPDNPVINKSINLSLGTEWKKLNLNGYIGYRDMKATNENRNETESYLPNGSQFAYNRGINISKNRNLLQSVNVQGALNDNTEINLRQSLMYNSGNTRSESSAATFNANPRNYSADPWENEAEIPHDARINKNISNLQNGMDNVTSNIGLLLTHKLNDIGRKLSFDLQNDYSNRTSDNYQQSSITYYQLTGLSGNDSVLHRNQYREAPSKNLSLAAEVSYTEPIGKQMLQVYYKYEYQRQSSDAATYDLNNDTPWGHLPPDYEAGKVDSLTDYTRNYFYTNEVGIRTTLNWKKVRINARFGLLPQKSTTKSDRGRIKVDTTVTVLNIVPELSFDYEAGKNKRIGMHYYGYTRQPSIYDLLPVADYTNPLNITAGNPGLKPAFMHTVSLFYTGGDFSKQESFYCNLGYNNTVNEISRKVIYDDKTGVRTSRPENINGNWGVRGHLSYTNKLFKKVFYQLRTNGNFNHRVAYVQVAGSENADDRNISKMLMLGQNIELSYKLDEHEFKLNGQIDYQQAGNSYVNSGNYETYDFYYGAECRLKLPLDLNFYTVIRSMNRRGYKDEASNTTQWLWNGELTYSFLKGKKGLLKLQVTDILQQRDFVNRWMNADGQGEMWTKGLGRYVMGTFTYRFNKL